MKLDAENVKYHNSLQVISAERFIFSLHDEFDMVREMLASHPSLKTGRRIEIVGGPKGSQEQGEKNTD